MTADIKNVISNCNVCAKYSNSQPKECIIDRQLPIRPWQIVAGDIIKGYYYILIADMYSKFPELITLKDLTAETTMTAIKSIFSRFGKPDILYTDNGSQFVNKDFQNFLTEWEVTHKTNSPRYSQSNGFVERHIQTIKKLIKKAIDDDRDIHLVLLEYRTTPIDSELPSPAELLYGRKIKGMIPVTENLLKTKNTDKNVGKILKTRQEKQKLYYNRSFRNLKPLKKDMPIFIQGQDKKWTSGRIIQKDVHRPRSYIVHCNKTNNTLIRNRKFLKPRVNINNEFEDQYFNELLDSRLANQYVENDYYVPNIIETESDKAENQNSNNTIKQESENSRLRIEKPTVNNFEGTAIQQYTTRVGRVIKR